ncbi:MAG: segregation and condensation protein A [Pleomorphochaeta sp.]
MADPNLDIIIKEDSHSFKIPTFEGPLELLLHLIQKSQINIYDIPISLITEQFLEYINNENNIELTQLSDFYKMAADLLYIKSRMLLPVDLDFDEDYDDPRQELVEQLLEYQKYRKYMELLTETANNDDLFIERKRTSFMIPYDDQQLFENIDLSSLLNTFSSIMKKISPAKVFNVYEEVSVNEKLAYLYELFEKKDEVTIEELIIYLEQPLHIICAFMAILDACKFRKITLFQKEPYKTILIKKMDTLNINNDEADYIDEMYDKAIETGLYNESEINDKIDKDDYSILENFENQDIEIDEDESSVDYDFGEFEEINLDEDE